MSKRQVLSVRHVGGVIGGVFTVCVVWAANIAFVAGLRLFLARVLARDLLKDIDILGSENPKCR
jgi:hypothetical protein